MEAIYRLNKEYITAKFCENRDKPQMKCCGKCYLKKQLKKADEQGNDSKDMPGKWQKESSTVFLVTTPIALSFQQVVKPVLFYDNYSFGIGYNAIASIFHPPPVSC